LDQQGCVDIQGDLRSGLLDDRQQRVGEGEEARGLAFPGGADPSGRDLLYHALVGVRSAEQFIAEAALVHDDELVAFFEFVRDQDVARAKRARELLAHRLSEADAHGPKRTMDPEVLRDFENAAE